MQKLKSIGRDDETPFDLNNIILESDEFFNNEAFQVYLQLKQDFNEVWLFSAGMEDLHLAGICLKAW